MDDSRLPPLARIAKKAGKMIKDMRPAIVQEFAAHPKGDGAGNPDIIEWKPDGSPVTAADKKAHEFICAEIQKDPLLKKAALLSYLPVLSEEGTKQEMEVALKARDRIETDPLDGTATYISADPRCNGYSVNIGRIVDGIPTEGAIYFPEINGGPGELFYTDRGKSYKQVGDDKPVEIRVRKRPLMHSAAFIQPVDGVTVDPRLIHDAITADEAAARLKVAVGFNEQKTAYLDGAEFDAIKAPGQYRTCMVAEGTADLTGLNEGLGGAFHTYDIAASHAVLRNAGGEIITYDPLKHGASMAFRYTSTTSTDVPAHIAGSQSELLEANLGTRESMGFGRKFS